MWEIMSLMHIHDDHTIRQGFFAISSNRPLLSR